MTAIQCGLRWPEYLDPDVVGDMGGNVWRFDIDDATPANWRGLQLRASPMLPGENASSSFRQRWRRKMARVTFSTRLSGFRGQRASTAHRSYTPATTDDRMFMLNGRSKCEFRRRHAQYVRTVGVIDTDHPKHTVDIAEIGGRSPRAASRPARWFRRLALARKLSMPHGVQNFHSSRLRFGTSRQPAVNACTPPGVGR